MGWSMASTRKPHPVSSRSWTKTWREDAAASPPPFKQLSSLDFTFPTYPSVELSSSTAVSPVASSEAILRGHLLNVGGFVTAAAAAFYMCYHYNRKAGGGVLL
eukprot:Blabericola_migrator_1__8962@NODE_4763_length_991_cov_5_086580_g2967_i0_p1_GENE_NODE_4763_length_991_cov_5_086580_g2967_i0NODE_4763_length_991_cov_5_086580_g2967_i0_p1_ORF_typecomplete_len103_score9_47DUF4538/PF15061_6/0_19_NODE_4763_length_991_cov_5_086580_g2967_i043351